MVSRCVIVAGLSLVFTGPVMAGEGLDDVLGQAVFERLWVGAPASTTSADGLGPVFDARACSTCHVQGGAGIATMANTGTLIGTGMILRLGNEDAAYSDSVYGTQLQLRALQGQRAEAAASLIWKADGTLRVPTLALDSFGYGPLASPTMVSLRRAPSLKGVDLIARVTQDDILAREDPDDADRDGISGRANWIRSANGARALGRFGWKAGEPNLRDQAARAFSRDMGISSSILPDPWGECTTAQNACRDAPHGGTLQAPEVSDELVGYVLDYLATLSPPKRALNAPGEQAFNAAGCASCHAGGVMSDLLLHDMGDGLADGIAEGEATPKEWRTAPLIDVAASLKRGGLLHDARARSVSEAVGWHGGEAASARDRYNALSQEESDALDKYVMGE